MLEPPATPNRPARPEDVDAICAALPETELGISYGQQPTWKVPRGPRGTFFCFERAPSRNAVDPVSGQEYGDLLVIRVPDPGAKAALVDDPASPFFTVEHFRGYNAVLIQQSRLGEITVGELFEILVEAWLAVAPKRLIRAHAPGSGGRSPSA